MRGIPDQAESGQTGIGDGVLRGVAPDLGEREVGDVGIAVGVGKYLGDAGAVLIDGHGGDLLYILVVATWASGGQELAALADVPCIGLDINAIDDGGGDA